VHARKAGGKPEASEAGPSPTAEEKEQRPPHSVLCCSTLRALPINKIAVQSTHTTTRQTHRHTDTTHTHT